jgi:hypothetical protein
MIIHWNNGFTLTIRHHIC